MGKRRGAHSAKQRASGSSGSRPIVAIVGRPNVGKSALFNRLTGASLAIVEDQPGVTRDRLYAEALALGRYYVLIDTGGFDPDSDDPLKQSIALQVRIALEEADVVICVLDATTSPLPADREAVALLRGSSLPVLYVANKADNPRAQGEALEHYELGMDSLMPISALHGHGIGDLEEALIAHFPPEAEVTSEEEEEVDRVAIVGRPNAGKSSLVNRLVGEKRQIVDDRPGTTVDSVDTQIEMDDAPLILIDTAGIRRKRSVELGLESLAVMQAIRAIERSNVIVLMIDANEGASEQDAKIAGLAIERGRAIVIALNKGDLLDDAGRKAALMAAREVFNFASWAPVQLVSVNNGRGVRKLMQLVRTVAKAHKHRVTTAAVNRFFEEVLEHHPPPTMNNRSVRLYYATQVQAAPPTFVIASNYPDRVHFSYRRYVVNQLRERFGFEGTPVRVFYRGKESRS
ncbi:MAG TPA: ribosome biogenesis GTPase Der [Polyangiales bacterium]|nr:ribosome biogenesis GTPase Der [Polyangiales bacterium]